ncbi:hypothetical protein SDC9_205254 [bioreactor metagenome]|uniref:Uncharacterized protein n=1 Tax=bioreactor metagenome TaxID=1076179 RepID=A0A645J351_9ZZZZ
MCGTALSFYSLSADVWGADDFGVAHQLGQTRWLGGKNVQGGAGDFAGVQCGQQSGFIDYATAGGTHDVHPLFHFGKGGLIEDAAGIIGERNMQGDDIGFCEDIFQGCRSTATIADLIRGQAGIVADHVHAKGFGACAHT